MANKNKQNNKKKNGGNGNGNSQPQKTKCGKYGRACERDFYKIPQPDKCHNCHDKPR